MSTYLPELLAPAKNKDYGIAAINHGADAVYIAADKFGAREAAGNSMSDVEQLVRYAHRYFAKVYLTLNTILFENELEEARRLAIQAYNAGCDALIVQDMALLEMDLPPITLHASTQTNNLTAEKIKFLADVGFSRVILGRELSIAKIAAIRQQTSVELEAFVHGALCVSHSGQCYLSSALTGRSANRGSCAQPCRSSYNLVDGNGKLLAKNKHLLSLRDFNLSDKIEDLYNAGVCSLKVEGRLKDISYLKNITSYYRKQVDKLAGDGGLKRPSSGKVTLKFEPEPELSFSRGFTNYFANGKQKSIASINTPKAIGERIGKVGKHTSTWFTLSGNNRLNNGDGICFFDKSSVLKGTKVNKVEGDRIFPLSMEGIVEDTEIFRNHNHLFEKQMAGDTAERLVGATLYFSADEHQITLTATDEDGVSVTLHKEQQWEEAKNEELARKSTIDNLSKSGSSMFAFNVQMAEGTTYFYPTSEINAWRRELASLLDAEREKRYKRQEVRIEKNSIPYPEQSLSYLGNVANSLAKQFYEQHGVTSIEQAFELAPKPSEALMTTHYCIRQELGICAKGKVGENTPSLYLLNNGRKFELQFDCKRCGMQIKLVK